MVTYIYTGGNNKKRYKTRGYGKLLSCIKAY